MLNDILFQLRDECWVFRGRAKVIVKGIVGPTYGLFPSPDYTEGVKEKKERRRMEREYVKQKVGPLIERDARFIYDIPLQVRMPVSVGWGLRSITI